MNDSTFAVAVFLVYMMLIAVVSAIATWIVLHGPHECQVEMLIAGQRATYITECML